MILILSIAFIVFVIAELVILPAPWRVVVGVACILFVILGLLGVVHLGGAR